MPNSARIAAALAVVVTAGCTVGPDFERPSAWSPSTWFSSQTQKLVETSAAPASQPVAAPIDIAWWDAFHDAELSALERRVAAENLDVRTATVRLAESRAQRRVTAAAEFPQINGDASYERQLPSAKGVFSLLGASGGAGGGIPDSGLAVKPFDLYQYGFDASWELDLWGRVRRSIEAADATIDASVEARRDALVSSLAEVARDYLRLRGAQTELAIARDNLAAARQSLDLTQARASAGLTSRLDVTSAEAEVASAEAQIPPLAQQEAQSINQLGFLLGQPPGALAAELATPRPLPPPPPRVPLGLPSELARRRPDIRAAEARLHAATAEIGVAKASFYPSITLNGTIDLQALRFADLGDWAARTYTLGPSLSIPIFEGGKLSGNLDLTEAQQQEAALAYQRTVLGAWQEVDDALIAYRAEQTRHAALSDAVVQNRQALAYARDQYAHGLVTYLQVLISEQQVFAAENEEASSAATMTGNLVSLYKALGGGWEISAPEEGRETISGD